MFSDLENLVFGDIEIDRRNFTVLRSGQNTNITPRAYDVLLLLIENRDRVVEKQEIFEKVWKDIFVTDNALTKVVKEIRQTIEDNASHPRYIETIPKRGYRFIGRIAIKEDGPTVGKKVSQKANPEFPEYDPLPSRQKLFSWRKVLPATLVLLMLMAAGAYYWGSRAANPGGIVQIDSIAVLPLANTAHDADTDYLADGITDNLANNLARFSGLRVASRSASDRYKDGINDAGKAGSELKVRSVLTGSVSRVGGQLVINISLDDVANSRHIWGEQYVRNFSDLIAVQSEIVRDITANLRLKLTDSEKKKLSRSFASNPDAYDLYLKGQYKWKRHTKEDLLSSVSYYDQALKTDPNFALPYAGIASAYAVLGNDYLPPRDAFPKAEANASKALSMDETLAEAHVAMAATRLYYDWNWTATENELKRALVLDPDNTNAHLLYGDYLAAVGRLDEAKAETQKALDLDPLSAMYNTNVGVALYYAGDDDAAIAQLKSTIELEPSFVNAYLYLGQAYEAKGLLKKAIDTFNDGLNRAERHPQLVAALGNAQAISGNMSEARKALNETERTLP